MAESAPLESPQARVARFRDPWNLMLSQVQGTGMMVDPPRYITAAGKAFEKEKGIALRYIQNLSTDALRYKVGSQIEGADDLVHGVLAGGVSDSDGLGSILDVSKFEGDIYVWSAGIVKACLFQAKSPEYNLSPNNF